MKKIRGRKSRATVPLMVTKTSRQSTSLTICRISPTPADFFLFQRGEVGAGRPSTAQGQPQGELIWGCLNHSAKTNPLQPFGGGWTIKNSMSELALSRP
jgi:hypothetical protein